MPRIFDDVFPLVDELTNQEEIDCFFFVRKPPGLRLRFSLRKPGRDTTITIQGCADSLVRRGLAERWFAGVYEAETFKFGGSDAIEAVHAYFGADCRAWWDWDRPRTDSEPSIDARLLSVSVLNDLFARFLSGPEEIWDVWCHVATLHGARVAGEGPRTPAPSIEYLINRVTPHEAAILRDYASANAIMASRFGELHENGKLLFAYRLVLPHLALYHWNRYGFTPADRALMFTAMIRAWSPHADRFG